MKKKKNIKHWHVISLYLLIYDVIAINCSYFISLLVRFDLVYSNIPMEYLVAFAEFTPFYTFVSIIIFSMLNLYNSLWRFASFSELNRIIIATVITTIFHVVGITIINKMPISYYFVGSMLQFLAISSIRFSYRYINILKAKIKKNKMIIHNAMIINAGGTVQIILKELNLLKESHIKAVCVIDDNHNKWNKLIDDIPVVGGKDYIFDAIDKYKVDTILIVMPSTLNNEIRDILNICNETDCNVIILPSVYQLANNGVSLGEMKPVSMEDLLGRDQIKVNLDEIVSELKGKTILVTGGGGSIGSELCRQIAIHKPKLLIVFDIYENNAYDIEQELKRKYKDSLNVLVLIGSVRDGARLDLIFDKYRPDIVYHAAAFKHVPLMEISPNESIKNNVIGTYNTAYTALKYGVDKFVLISTDKAVNPVNIMGASKRLCEMIIQTMNEVSLAKKYDVLPSFYHNDKENNGFIGGTQFVAVRFGNVLGSNGSVIPLFKKQIEAGGPVTVTNPEVIRYFMTINEAVSLVLQAGKYAQGGEIFVLDMGEPVKIDTLAKNLIKLSGYKVNEDIKIEYTSLRPGEKMYEEKLMLEEGLERTSNNLIYIGKPIRFDKNKLLRDLVVLNELANNNSDDIIKMVQRIVPTFKHN